MTHATSISAGRLNVLVDGIVNFFASVAEFPETVRRARDMQNTYDVLSRLSDSELAARGLERKNIVQYVLEA